MALIDDVFITVKAGDGGKASGSRDGGHGGAGGNIYFQASNNISDLSSFRFVKKIVGKLGGHGQRNKMTGRNAEDELVLVPPGTKVTDEANGESVEIMDFEKKVLIAKGGYGGGSQGTIFNHQTGEVGDFSGGVGEEKYLHLVQSLIADIGFVGLPNAGKSSLLTVLTNATPKIGNYPFTTLEPNLGICEDLVLADIPGLIEGAAEGSGLGVKFLKHIEKTKMLIHCISVEDPDPLKTYKIVREEFEKYNPELLDKDEIILFTKIDLIDPAALVDQIKKMKTLKKKVQSVSIYDEKSLGAFKKNLISYKKRFNTVVELSDDK